MNNNVNFINILDENFINLTHFGQKENLVIMKEQIKLE
jgi:hypothetical protein